ncbi:MAG: DivIVA domain-containing protein, partial [Ilumatobacteraceae bacterium]
MALSPQRIRETSFKAARRGYDQGEVDAFVEEVAGALETAQNEATAMEARARAAVARLQELSQGGAPTDAAPTGTSAPAATETKAHVEESETISRTLLLAQRTADQAVADAQAEADQLRAAAQQDATGQLDGARADAAELIEAAKADARRDGEAERVRVEGEVQALLARRDFLESDVEHLEQFVMAQRERIVEATSELQALCQRVPAGLADMRRPLLSASSEPTDPDEPEPTMAIPATGASATGPGPGAEHGEGSELSEI